MPALPFGALPAMYWPSSMTIVRVAPLRPGHTGSPSGLAIFTCKVKTFPLRIADDKRDLLAFIRSLPPQER